MSGGHWDYRQYQAVELLEDVGKTGEVVIRFPKLAQVFRDCAQLLDDTLHDIDWDLSGDSSIENDEEFEKQFIKKIGFLLEKKYKVKVYEVNP